MRARRACSRARRADHACRLSRRFSLIHDARPSDLSQPAYTQALFASALGSLGVGGEACDTSVVFALLLLYHTQRCEPRVPVYLSAGEPALRGRLARPSHARDNADKLLRLSRSAERASARGDSELLPALRALLAQDALVVGAAEQPSLSAPCASSRHPVAAAEEHLAASLDAAREFSAGDLRACADAYAAAAGRCGPPTDCSALMAVLQGVSEAIATVDRQAHVGRSGG